MTNARRERGYDIILYQPVCPPRSCSTDVFMRYPSLAPHRATVRPSRPVRLPCSRGPRATALADSNVASRRHSTSSRVTCRTQQLIVTVYRVSEVLKNVCSGTK